MIYSPRTTHMCPMLRIYTAHFFRAQHTLQSAISYFVARGKLFEHVEKSMNEIGFKSFYENHNEYRYKHKHITVQYMHAYIVKIK